MGRARKEHGFTLTEVLAALVIFSFGILGLTQAGTESAAGAARLKSKSLAAIVADNEIAKLDLITISAGKREGQQSQMGRDFEYVIETENTDVNGFFKVIVTVREEDQTQALIQRTAFRKATPS